jgi:uncharacterized protein YggE
MRLMVGVAMIALIGADVSAAPVPPRAAEPYVATISSNPPLYGPAPWWMREPVIAASGEVQTHIPANRAQFSAQFSSIDRSLATAQKNAADKVRALAKTLQAYGADKAQVETSLYVNPIYEQYRDKDGNLLTNNRPDKTERYEVRVTFNVQLRDMSVLERAYAAVVSAHPVSVGQVYFSLEPSNETNSELFKAAVADAARRGRDAAEATGARLGKVRLIDPTSRACETDVLVAGAPRGLGEDAGGVQEVMVTASKRMASPAMAMAPPAPPPPPPPPPPPAPGEEVSADQLLPLQPPLQTLQRRACVVYGLE